jgi:hypothetical protein
MNSGRRNQLREALALDVVAVWDNSVNNRYNPDPTGSTGVTRVGRMLLAWATLQIDPDTDVDELFHSNTK